MKSLLLGCGRNRQKKVRLNTSPDWAGELVTLDMNPNCGADVVWDLEQRPLPFPDEEFDEIGAFDVLEHIGKIGDWRGYFEEFAEYWRLLKPGGLFFILVPTGPDADADPGHTRYFGRNWFGFLSQKFYENPSVTDYRWFYKLNFDVVLCDDYEGHHLAVILRKN